MGADAVSATQSSAENASPVVAPDRLDVFCRAALLGSGPIK